MTDNLSDLILSLAPEDGSTIGNGAMKALLREQVPELSNVAEIALDHTEELTAAPKAAKANGKARKKIAKTHGPPQVVSYRHCGTASGRPLARAADSPGASVA